MLISFIFFFEIDTSKAQSKDTCDVIYLIGDAGEYTYQTEALIEMQEELSEQIDEARSTVVFLGDNIYSKGAPYSKDYIAKIGTQLEAISNFSGNIIFLPGNHDWKNGMRKGMKAVIEQANYIDTYLSSRQSKTGETNVVGFYPKNATPGPVVMKLQFTNVIILDSQWWFQKFWLYRPVGKNESIKKTSKNFWENLEKYLRDAHLENKKAVIVAHHPLYSIGGHGSGLQPWRFIGNLLFPLRILGLDRALGQDIPQPFYKKFRKKIIKCIRKSEINGKDVFYAAGHEHNLQYHKHRDLKFNHIVSGAGSKTSEFKLKLVNKKINKCSTLLYPKFTDHSIKHASLGYFKLLIGRDTSSIIIKEVYSNKNCVSNEILFQVQ